VLGIGSAVADLTSGRKHPGTFGSAVADLASRTKHIET
jgi:hypothetical protein